jgi:hypothetical protein
LTLSKRTLKSWKVSKSGELRRKEEKKGRKKREKKEGI